MTTHSLGKLPLVALLAALGLALGACGKKKTPPPEPTKAPATSEPATAPPEAKPDAAAEDKPDAAAEDKPDAAAMAADSGAPEPAADAAAASAKKVVSITSKVPAAIELYQAALELLDNARGIDALVQFKKALELDPEFVQAQAYVGLLTPTAEGVAMVDKAVAAAANLPEAERVSVEVVAALRKGDTKRAADLSVKLTELAPDDWRVYFVQAQRAGAANDTASALEALKRAAELNPNNAGLQNQFGYALLLSDKKDEAISAFRRYVELAPTEPNPYDSLGEALLAAGKLEEAEASFLKAIEVEPTFTLAWGGVAACRALAGNWEGATEALGKLRASTVAADRYDGTFQLAWLQLAQGDAAAADKTLAELETTAVADGQITTATFAQLVRARFHVEEDTLDGIEALFDAASAHAQKEDWNGGGLRAAKRMSVGLRAIVAARQDKAEEAKKLLSELDALVAEAGRNADANSLLHEAHGRVMVVTDPKAGAEELAKCEMLDSLCSRAEIAAREKAGDKEGAEAVKSKLVAWPIRDIAYVYARAKLGTIPAKGE